MLVGLQVKNIALIDEVSLHFHQQLNIFSGETGAGKSMLIDSIQFAIGNRTSKQIIRKGQQSAYVKIMFEDTRGNALEALEEEGIPYDKNEINIERTLYVSGRTVYKINGMTATRVLVKEIAARLIDVHGQHEPQSLLDVSKHLKMLDSFGKETFQQLKADYEAIFKRWKTVKMALEKVDGDERKKLQLKDILTFQIEEISKSQLKIGEEESLKEEFELLSHAEKIIEHCDRAYGYLEERLNAEGGATSLVGKASNALQDISHINTTLKNLYEELLNVEAQLQDISYELRRYTDTLDYSPGALTTVQDRLDLLYRLKQKYGTSVEEILAYQAQCEQELKELVSNDERKETLKKEYILMTQKLKKASQALSLARQDLAKEVEKKIDFHLHDLQMPHAKFEVAVTPSETYSTQGHDHVEFLIRTNAGEDVHALAKIASGGEISRVMLAIKTVLVLGDTIDTVIFDEIDTGISGIAAQKVGEKLAMIADKRQVICITHLPQIAVMGDTNYLIEKYVEADHTKTSLTPLKEQSLYQEISRMMGGLVTDTTLESAKELRDKAQSYKKSFR